MRKEEMSTKTRFPITFKTGSILLISSLFFFSLYCLGLVLFNRSLFSNISALSLIGMIGMGVFALLLMIFSSGLALKKLIANRILSHISYIET
ncbi:MAG: hypothetical protein KAU17_08615, partial [Spirochaetales bacterium]|nr:hypothetical protein [Spirochaetales bacterium]